MVKALSALKFISGQYLQGRGKRGILSKKYEGTRHIF